MDGPQTKLKCAVCGSENEPASLFCRQCTAPLTVVGLHELTDRDREICSGALMEVLGAAMQSGGAGEAIDEDLWNAYLSAQWLRPETALIQYGEALAIRKLTRDGLARWLD